MLLLTKKEKMITQITEKSIGHRIRFHLFYSKYKWLYFRVSNGNTKNIQRFAEEIEKIQKGKLPIGVYAIDIVIENIFGVQHDETDITEEKVIEFAKSLKL
jgi:hypothetical protein